MKKKIVTGEAFSIDSRKWYGTERTIRIFNSENTKGTNKSKKAVE